MLNYLDGIKNSNTFVVDKKDTFILIYIKK